MAGLCWGERRGNSVTLSEDGTKATLCHSAEFFTIQEVLANEVVRGGESFSWTIDVERDPSLQETVPEMAVCCGALRYPEDKPQNYGDWHMNIGVNVESGMHVKLTLIRPEDDPEKCVLRVQKDDQEPFQREERFAGLEKEIEMSPFCLLFYGWSVTIGSVHNQLKPAKRE